MITVHNLSKSYGSHAAVSDLSFEVPDGTVTGFLGPNGSGKSTTMRAILGLHRPTNGTAIFSGPGYSGRFTALPHKAQVASAVLSPRAFDGRRSALNHLRVLAHSAGVPERRATECLEQVGLGGVGKQPARRLSLGMQQRLCLAGALLGRPQHLLLDEPINGLDPAGVAWMRDTIRQLADAGCAVLVSSHLLAELQRTADRVVLISQGRLVGEYELDEMCGGQAAVAVRTPTPDCLARVLPLPSTPQPGGLAVPLAGRPAASVRELVARTALDHGILVTELTSPTCSLEEAYLAVTARAARKDTDRGGEYSQEAHHA